MIISVIIAVAYFGIAALGLRGVKTRTINEAAPKKYGFLVYVPLFLIVRLILAAIFPGHQTDMACFYSWSETLYKNGFSDFYTADFFSDYPPGYMYILYVLGFLKNIFSLNIEQTYFLLKMPAIISDILCGYIIYKVGKDGFTNKGMAILMLSFILNPAVVTDSAVWGQVDSVLTVFVLWMLYLTYKGKLVGAYFVFMASLIIKPQAVFYGPILLFATIDTVFVKEFTKEKLINHIEGIVWAVALGILALLPFGLSSVMEQYAKTLASYNYATVNAYNLWSAFGLNFKEPTFFISLVGYLSIILTVVMAGVIYFKTKTPDRVFYTAAFICLSIFVLSIKMHERYAYPAIALLLAAFCASGKKPDFLAYTAISSIQFVNYIQALFYYRPQDMYSWFNPALIAGGIVITAFFAIYYIYSMKRWREN